MRVRLFSWVTMIASLLAAGTSALAQHPGLGAPYGIAAAPMPAGYGPPPGYAPAPYTPTAYDGVMGGPVQPPGAPMGMADQGFCQDCYGGGGYGNACCPGWTNKYFAFGEYLYLRPRNAEVAYALPIDGALVADPITGPLVAGGPVATVDPGYSSGFRVGFGAVLSECSQIAVTYSQLDNDQFDNVSLPGTDTIVLRSLVTQPNPITADGDGVDAAATLQTQFKLLDVDYKSMWANDANYQVAWVIGARYGKLLQNFAAGFATPTVIEEVLARSEFDGGGIKLGLEGQRYGATNQFFVYGKGNASFLAGSFRTQYFYNEIDAARVNISNTSLNIGRVVSVLDLETGIGWRNFNDNLRLSVGYMFSGWFNTVRVNEWINAVQNSNFVDPSDNFNGMTTFDGLTARIELLW